ncbi:MAG: hypothetical protein Q9162_005376 [Coniocarpon cinnabarinum]
MSSNVGLATPRGSGTSGYVQRNLSHPKPRSKPYPSLDDLHNDAKAPKHKPRQPDAEILAHDRKRQIEVKVLELRDALEEKGELDEDAIDDACEQLREKLGKEEEKIGKKDARGLKGYQTHELAEAKGEEQERMRKALGIREDYEEGSHWRGKEERLRAGLREDGGKRREEPREEEEDLGSEGSGSESDDSRASERD